MPNLNADELGEKGESRFREICADAKLICNHAERDRTGWDFLVEFEFGAADDRVSLESRCTPLSCHVQVKTLKATGDTVRLRLSSAERLAKELKPTFIYVLKVNDELMFTEAHLIHLLDGNLEKILKRLRLEHAKGDVRINKKFIQFSARRDGTPVGTTGEALRLALTKKCSPDVHTYTANKQRQLQQLGYGPTPIRGKMTFASGNAEEIVDAFLGLKEEIPISRLEVIGTRFGISRPLHKTDGGGVVRITPNPVDQCTILLKREVGALPVLFQGQLYVPALPGLPFEHLKILVKSDFFSITTRGTDYTLSLDLADINDRTHSPADWLRLWKLMYAIVEEGGLLEITCDHGSRWELPFPAQADLVSASTCKYWIELCERASYLLALGGAAYEPKLLLADIHAAAKQLWFLSAVFKRESVNPRVSLRTSKPPEIKNVEPTAIRFVNTLPLGGLVLAYEIQGDATPTFNAQDVEWHLTQLTPLNIRALPQEAVPAFVASLEADSKQQNSISVVPSAASA